MRIKKGEQGREKECVKSFLRGYGRIAKLSPFLVHISHLSWNDKLEPPLSGDKACTLVCWKIICFNYPHLTQTLDPIC